MNYSKKIFKKEGLLFILLSVLILSFILLKFNIFKANNSVETVEYSAINVEGETCKNCHIQNTGFSQYHNPELIGCVSCHLGNPNVEGKEESHKGMVLIPGNLSNADATCGTCHKNELNKIKHSLMTTNSGLAAFAKDQRMNSIMSLEKITVPVLDLYGDDDLENILASVESRAAAAKKAGNNNYTQIKIKGNHFFDGNEATLVETVAEWLEESSTN